MTVEKFEKVKVIVTQQLNSIDKGSHLQNYLFIMYGPFVNYTESIIILCESGKVNAAGVLLRSLIEAHININYMQTVKSEEHLAEAALESARNKISICNNFINLIKKHPHLKSSDKNSLYNVEKLNFMKDWANVELKKLIELNDFDSRYEEPKFKMPLLQKAVACDDEKFNSVPEGYHEEKYTLEYRFLSPLAHLNIEGLGHFVVQVDATVKHKDSSEIEMIQGSAIGLYMALVKDMYEHKVLLGNIPAELE